MDRSGNSLRERLSFGSDFYSRNPLISLIRDKIVLQLQLITPGSVAISEIMKPVEEYDNVKR